MCSSYKRELKIRSWELKGESTDSYLFKFQQSLNAHNTAVCNCMVHAFVDPETIN